MCEFISFFVSIKENKIVCGDPTSHSNAPVHSGMGDWREAEWTSNNNLEIRVNSNEDESAYKATVLAVAPNRKALAKQLSPSRDSNGNIYYFNELGYHRDGELPAIICTNSGTKCYYRDGLRHRDGDLPAIILSNGTKRYYKNGKLHRDGDLPATIHPNGEKYYYKNGLKYNTEKLY